VNAAHVATREQRASGVYTRELSCGFQRSRAFNSWSNIVINDNGNMNDGANVAISASKGKEITCDRTNYFAK
jgi:hypothetical protein